MRKKARSQRFWSFVGGCLLLILISAWMLADMPVVLHFMIQWEPLKTAARTFSPEEFEKFEKNMEDSKATKPVTFKEFDPSFTNVYESYLFGALLEFITPHLKKGEPGKVRNFFKTINENKWIQGMEISRRGGHFVAILSLTVNEASEYVFQYLTKPIKEGEYQGTTFNRGTGIFSKVPASQNDKRKEEAKSTLQAWPSSDVEIQMPRNSKDLVITLERTMCFGTCPVYKVAISGDGAVVYSGEAHVKVVGSRKIQIDEQKMKQLISLFKKIDYFSLKDNYDTYDVTDFPWAITSLSIEGRTKKVRHYHGDRYAPEELTELENNIDEIVNTKQWIQ